MAHRAIDGEHDDEEGCQEEEEDQSLFGILPDEVLIHLLGFLDGKSVLRLQCVSSRLRRIGADERVWRRLCFRDFHMRYLTSQALWIHSFRGVHRQPGGPCPTLPYFPFSQPTTPYTVKKGVYY